MCTCSCEISKKKQRNKAQNNTTPKIVFPEKNYLHLYCICSYTHGTCTCTPTYTLYTCTRVHVYIVKPLDLLLHSETTSSCTNVQYMMMCMLTSYCTCTVHQVLLSMSSPWEPDEALLICCTLYISHIGR